MRSAFLSAGLWCGAGIAAIAVTVVACGDGPPKPGFQELGGSGGSGDAATASNGSSTHASSGVTSSVATTSVSSSVSSTVASSSSGPVCDDPGPGEPNDSEATAFNLGTIGDCDGDGDTTSGVLDGPFDVDWFKYNGTDGNCVVDPDRQLQSSGPVRLCKFFQCANAEIATFTCPSGSVAATSPVGRPGCCSMGGFNIGDLKCGGSIFDADSAAVFIRVDNPQALPCPSYSIAYHY